MFLHFNSFSTYTFLIHIIFIAPSNLRDRKRFTQCGRGSYSLSLSLLHYENNIMIFIFIFSGFIIIIAFLIVELKCVCVSAKFLYVICERQYLITAYNNSITYSTMLLIQQCTYIFVDAFYVRNKTKQNKMKTRRDPQKLSIKWQK